MMLRLPDDDAFIAVFANMETPDSGRIANELGRMLLGQTVEPPVERKAVTIAPEILERYTGKYQLGPATFNIKSEKTHLIVEVTNQPTITFYPESETKVFTKVIDAQLSFSEIADGKAQKMTLHQNGREQPAKRIP